MCDQLSGQAMKMWLIASMSCMSAGRICSRETVFVMTVFRWPIKGDVFDREAGVRGRRDKVVPHLAWLLLPVSLSIRRALRVRAP